ncbi:hypothetical protein BDV33DRAFT_21668 [Aspergillus novoparasiticus]|uniref:Uncharacterized protein n=1 Tax=Aspergillus novoparasiticus TaxID=986946 RepID=A0A5N6EBI4_9EURO|nr:hypothetical protein BDV33DRAFT_21668 [Aspergillus novoparasiticus]
MEGAMGHRVATTTCAYTTPPRIASTSVALTVVSEHDLECDIMALVITAAGGWADIGSVLVIMMLS